MAMNVIVYEEARMASLGYYGTEQSVNNEERTPITDGTDIAEEQTDIPSADRVVTEAPHKDEGLEEVREPLNENRQEYEAGTPSGPGLECVGEGDQDKMLFSPIRKETPIAESVEKTEEEEMEESIAAIKDGLKTSTEAAVRLGFHLDRIRKRKWYKERGYESFEEFVEKEFNLSESRAYRFRRMWEKFSDQETENIAPKYSSYSISQLQEMLTMKEEDLQSVTPETTVAKMKEMKRARRKTATSQATSAQEPDKAANEVKKLAEVFPVLLAHISQKEDPEVAEAISRFNNFFEKA